MKIFSLHGDYNVRIRAAGSKAEGPLSLHGDPVFNEASIGSHLAPMLSRALPHVREKQWRETHDFSRRLGWMWLCSLNVSAQSPPFSSALASPPRNAGGKKVSMSTVCQIHEKFFPAWGLQCENTSRWLKGRRAIVPAWGPCFQWSKHWVAFGPNAFKSFAACQRKAVAWNPLFCLDLINQPPVLKSHFFDPKFFISNSCCLSSCLINLRTHHCYTRGLSWNVVLFYFPTLFISKIGFLMLYLSWNLMNTRTYHFWSLNIWKKTIPQMIDF